MQKALVMVGLVLLTAVAFATPPAAAADLCQIFQDPPQACYTAQTIVFSALDYALCFYNTAPSQWGNCV
jgi:hypothetical protein